MNDTTTEHSEPSQPLGLASTAELAAVSPVDRSFDDWYAAQSHQLTNEQVCRLIWRRGWGAAAAQYGASFEREEARADAAEAQRDALQAALLEAMRVLAKVDPKGAAAWLRSVGG